MTRFVDLLWPEYVIDHDLDSTTHTRSNSELCKSIIIYFWSIQFMAVIQMEEFTRECLEVDKDVNGERSEGRSLFVGTSMEQIYERAARLVKRTLDVEGAVVMDVSHVDVLETITAESTTSISIHNDDPEVGTVNRMLNADEVGKLQEFFAKNNQGKICEGVLPSGLRPFLPLKIQSALGTSAGVLGVNLSLFDWL